MYKRPVVEVADNQSQVCAVGGCKLIVTIVVRRRKHNGLVATGFTADAKGTILPVMMEDIFQQFQEQAKKFHCAFFSISSSNHITPYYF